MVDTANLLNKEEREALSAAVLTGAIPVDTGYNTRAVVRKHDLTNEDSSLGVNVSSLDMINERFIRLFRLSLLEVLRTSPRINPSRVQLLKFGEYQKELHAPLSVNVIRMNPLRGLSMILIDPNMVFTALDNFFGGAGRGIGTVSPARLFTLTETRVINILLDVMFKCLQEAWQPIQPVDFETVSSEVNPQFAQIADENDLVIVNHFDADFGDSKGFIDIVYPYSALKPIREQLRSRVQAVDGDEESDKRWSTELKGAIDDAELLVQVMLGKIKMTMNELNNLKEGDLLYFKKTGLARVQINDIPVYEAVVGSKGPNVAVQIQKVLEIPKP